MAPLLLPSGVTPDESPAPHINVLLRAERRLLKNPKAEREHFLTELYAFDSALARAEVTLEELAKQALLRLPKGRVRLLPALKTAKLAGGEQLELLEIMEGYGEMTNRGRKLAELTGKGC